MWTNRPVAGSLSKENGSFDQENAHFKKNTPIRFEAPSVPGGITFQFLILRLRAEPDQIILER